MKHDGRLITDIIGLFCISVMLWIFAMTILKHLWTYNILITGISFDMIQLICFISALRISFNKYFGGSK